MRKAKWRQKCRRRITPGDGSGFERRVALTSDITEDSEDGSWEHPEDLRSFFFFYVTDQWCCSFNDKTTAENEQQLLSNHGKTRELED